MFPIYSSSASYKLFMGCYFDFDNQIYMCFLWLKMISIFVNVAACFSEYFSYITLNIIWEIWWKLMQRNILWYIIMLKWDILLMSLTSKFLNLLFSHNYLIIDVSFSAESVMVINIDKYRQIYLKLHDWLSYI